MEPDGSIPLSIILLALLVLFGAFFTMSETAVISLNDGKIKKMAHDGNKKALLISRLISSPSKFLAMIQVGSTISGFLASAVAAVTFTEYIVYAMRDVPVSPQVIRGTSIFVIAVVISYFSLAFGQLIPKRAAMQNPERISFKAAPALSVFYALFKPFVLFLSATSGGVLRLIGVDPDKEPEKITEEEIRMMVDVGGERGSIEVIEKEMINNIFEFDDRTVDEMMTHRTEIVFVNIDDPLERIVEIALESGYSRIPVCRGGLDSIAGILYVKDLLSLLSKETLRADFSLENYMREPLYVLESNPCTSILSEFKAKKIQIAIVADEYGGTSGLITMEDLIESIIGNIQDEYDDEEDKISILDENRYEVDGLTSLDDVDKFFDLNLSADEEIETIGGYIISRLDRIPDEGETPSVDAFGYRFIVKEMDERRVAKLEVERLATQESTGLSE